MTAGWDEVDDWEDLAYWAWTIIANAGLHQGGWDSQDPEWVAAAKKWRDTYHRMM